MDTLTVEPEQCVVSFQEVSKRYQSKDAVSSLSFSVPAGKVVGLIGPNGSGKTTTLKLMTGLLRPTCGSVQMRGEAVTRAGASRRISYLSDDAAVYSFYTVGQMLDYYAGMYGDFDLQKATKMLSFMKLEAHEGVRILSKGNLGRLKLILALSRQVPLIVMDEPLSGLDPLVRQSIMKGLISFIDLDRQTVVLSTHEVDEVEPLLDVVLLLEAGRIRGMAYTEDIRVRYGESMVGWMREVLET